MPPPAERPYAASALRTLARQRPASMPHASAAISPLIFQRQARTHAAFPRRLPRLHTHRYSFTLARHVHFRPSSCRHAARQHSSSFHNARPRVAEMFTLITDDCIREGVLFVFFAALIFAFIFHYAYIRHSLLLFMPRAIRLRRDHLHHAAPTAPAVTPRRFHILSSSPPQSSITRRDTLPPPQTPQPSRFICHFIVTPAVQRYQRGICNVFVFTSRHAAPCRYHQHYEHIA